MIVDKPPPAGPIASKIAWAEMCRSRLKDVFEHDQRVAALMVRFRDAVRASRREMAATGIVRLCRQCEEDEGGSCCGEGLEDRYDPWLLLINLLLGTPLPRSRPRPGSCYFLGDTGCLLLARHTICINYVCAKITNRISPGQISRLRELEGVELDTLFLLDEAVKRVVRCEMQDTRCWMPDTR
jgi:hypothetical protein